MASSAAARADRVEVVVTSLSAYYAHARDDFGESYFIYPGNFQMTGGRFEDIQEGSRLRGLPIAHPKGQRLIEIRLVEV
jgi:hypothetical protein